MTMTLKEIYKIFPTEKSATKFLEDVIWDNKPICPYCKSGNFTVLSDEDRYHCNTCNSSYSVTVHTLFHKTKCDLQKWFYAMYIFLKKNESLSARKLGLEISVTKDTAWKMIFKIKKWSMESPDFTNKILNELMNKK